VGSRACKHQVETRSLTCVDTEPVVNDVIAALRDKSYLPKSTPDQAKPPVPQSIRSIVGNANFEYEPHPSDVPFGAPRGPAATRFSNGSHTQALHNLQQDGSNLSRKRKLVEGDAGQGPESHYNRNGGGNNRPLKQTSRGRGGRNARGGGMEAQNNFSSFPGMPNFANFPPPPSGPLPFDPTDPTAFFAMAAAFGANLSPMSSLPVLNQGRGLNKKKGKCSDYHNIGFCALGNFCQYEHGGTIEDVLEYDPEQSFLAVQPDAGLNKQTAPRSQSSELNGVRLRMKFSQQGKPYNTTNTTIVVEPIPKEYCDEDNVRDFFSHFGNIVDIEMDTHRRLAIVKFDDNAAAAGAYTSPKAIFDNRFVKVYWYNPTDFERPPPTQTYGDTDMKDGNDGEEKLDPEEIAKRQAEAQQAFDERRRKADKAEARAADIERKLKEKNEEMEQIRKQLAELSGDKADEFSQNLAELQAEADSLFAQHEPSTSARGGYVGRGRGATFSALGGYFPPNGRGYTAFRGAHRGRVRFPSTLPRNPNKKLDNRPRRLAVMGIEAGTARDEALRQHLLVSGTCG
jgi:RNA recognition motif-containing protein